MMSRKPELAGWHQRSRRRGRLVRPMISIPGRLRWLARTLVGERATKVVGRRLESRYRRVREDAAEIAMAFYPLYLHARGDGESSDPGKH